MDAGDKKRSIFATNHKKTPLSRHRLAETDKERWQDSSLRYGRNFSFVEAMLILLSLLTYLVDTVTDVLVGVQYIQQGDLYWGGMTLGFVLAPGVIIQLFSFRWYVADGRTQGCRGWLVHLFMLQPLERYLYALVAGMEARHTKAPEDIDNYYHQQNDVCMLRLFEAFLESAPQLTLQMYIMFYTDSANWLTVASACISLSALGLAVAAYGHAMRQVHRNNYFICWPGLGLQTVWHIAMVASRVMALVAFTSVFKPWVFLFIAMHWVFMTSWIIAQNTDFCGSQWEEVFFDCVAGFIYCYSFFNLKEGRSRWRMTAYYSLVLLENAGLMGAWYYFRDADNPLNNLIMATVIGGFFMGLCCMLLYYRFCHPSGPIHCCQTRLHTDTADQKSTSMHAMPLPLPVNHCSTPHLPHKMSAASNFSTQVSWMGKQPSSLTLSRRSLLKSHIHLNPAKTGVVQFKEVATPSQLSPIKCSDHTPHRSKSAIYADTTDIKLDDISAFQHYSVDATACLFNSRCNTLTCTGVDLSKAGYLDDVVEDVCGKASKQHSLLSAEDGHSLPEEDSGQCESEESCAVTASASPSPIMRPRTGSVHCSACGYAPHTVNFYPQCCQSPAYKQTASVVKPCTHAGLNVSDSGSAFSLPSSDGEEQFSADFHELSRMFESPMVRETDIFV